MKTNTAAKLSPSYTILDTIFTNNPKNDANIFGACLAVDKGYSSRIVRIPGGYDVVASDNRAIRFTFRPKVVK